MKSETINKVGMSIDVLPTVLNLFGMEYDSRIIMGKDILSTSLGLAIFKDKSWVTDKGTYYASSGKFVGEDVDEDYIKKDTMECNTDLTDASEEKLRKLLKIAMDKFQAKN
jgi:phosphoglycerol transferase MdoB-like AlkP superfamily enzyme